MIGKKKYVKKINKRIFIRNDKKELLLFGYNEHNENVSTELEITEIPKPHMRWSPSREDWIAYSSGRKNRTSFPPKEYCPLCPSSNPNFPTEIPFENFEVAVFPNRWASFNLMGTDISSNEVLSKAAKGECEVVVYSQEHSSTVSEMSYERIELLIHVWIDRYINLYKNSDVKYVLPFENRGEECGVTLHHPHGQIYAYPFIPPIIKQEIKAFKKENFIMKMMKELEDKYYHENKLRSQRQHHLRR